MDLRDFLCGLAAGWMQITTGYPLDYIKTKIQLTNTSFAQAWKSIYNQHGVKGYYRGASSLVFGFSFVIGL